MNHLARLCLFIFLSLCLGKEAHAQAWVGNFMEGPMEEKGRLEIVAFDADYEVSEDEMPVRFFSHWRFPLVRDFRSGMQLRAHLGIYPFGHGSWFPTPHAVYLDAFLNRLYRLIGKGNALVVQHVLFVQGPITQEDGVIFGRACQPHNCGRLFLRYWYDTRTDQMVALFANQRQFHLYLEQPHLSPRISARFSDDGWFTAKDFGWE